MNSSLFTLIVCPLFGNPPLTWKYPSYAPIVTGHVELSSGKNKFRKELACSRPYGRK